MASPMIDGRVEPHRKATYTLDISEQIRKEDVSGNGFSSVKYNHKPTLSSGTRTTTLQSSTSNTFNLSLEDRNGDNDNNIFVFNGSRTTSSKSYILLFDQTTQKATLERLDSTYTFNLSTKNGSDVSADYEKIYPKKSHKDSVHDKEGLDGVDLFGDEQEVAEEEDKEPDKGNPYDFRHFLNAVKNKKGDTDKEYASSPDYKSDCRSSASTVRGGAADRVVPPVRRAVEPPAKKRKAASVFAPKPAAKGKKVAPIINLERRASDRPAPSTSKNKTTIPAVGGNKIKSAEFVQPSDESDVDAEGEPDSTVVSPRHYNKEARRLPSLGHHSDDEDAEGEEDPDDDSDDGGLEIEVPDAGPGRSILSGKNSHLGIGGGGGAGVRGLRSPSNGPISLASAANSVEGTPRRGAPADEIDFGDFDAEGEEEDDGDMDNGHQNRQDGRKSVSGAAGNGGSGPGGAEVDEDDPLYMEMIEGLADSSEESEEE